MHAHLVRLVLAVSIAFLASCSHYSKAKEIRDSALTENPGQQTLLRAINRHQDEPAVQLGGYLDAADAARVRLAANPADTLARSDYNFAVSRIIETIGRAGLKPWDAPIPCPSASGQPWSLTLPPPDPRPQYHPSKIEIRAADRYEFDGKLVGERKLKPGLGAPVVVVASNQDLTKLDQFVQSNQAYYGLTALARFRGRDCVLALVDPLSVETVSFENHTYPLAADFQAPLALSLAELHLEKRELAALFKPAKYEQTARLARLQPYDPKKIPVLCIHGLGNSAATWMPVIDHLRNNAVIRQNYQFWFFMYPSGLPYPMMAAELRRQLAEMRKTYPDHKDMVVIGHSMGGMITRLLMTDSGTAIWDTYFDRPPAALPVSESTRQLVSNALIFDAQPDIARVIFASASHRGSEMATGGLGRFGARLVGNPISENQINQEINANVRPEIRASGRGRLPNSVEVLDPSNTFLQTIDPIPLDPDIPFHSLMGDRGKGGNLSRTKPVSSDGIVPYWSSHLDGAQSELIVPSDHWSHNHPLGTAEIERILLLHVGS